MVLQFIHGNEPAIDRALGGTPDERDRSVLEEILLDHVTRVLTTAIALETGRGDFAMALGLGFVLITLAIVVNLMIHSLSRTERSSQW